MITPSLSPRPVPRTRVGGAASWALALLVVFWAGATSAQTHSEKVLNLAPAEGFDTELDALEIHAIAVSLGRDELAEAALADGDWPQPLSQWVQARRALDRGDLDDAWRLIDRAARGFGRLGEPWNLLAPDLDRDRLRIAVDRGDAGDAGRVLERPLADHEGDALWLALEGCALALDGDVSNAALRLDQAWRLATSALRRDPIFAHRPLAHLAAGDELAAAETWLEYALGLRWAEEKRLALAAWEAHPELEKAVARAGVRDRAAVWLARSGRREEALEQALAAWRGGTGEESRRGYFLASEQLYRLRRHEELLALVAERRPRDLSREEQAELDSHPWGIARRAGHSIEIAKGYDELSRQYRGTDRAIEAIWEAAWMWELSGEIATAEARYLEYATMGAAAPLAAAAIERALYLAFREGRYQEVLDRHAASKARLGSGKERASGLWLAAHSAEELGKLELAATLNEELVRKHPDCPWVRRPPSPVPVPEALPAEAARALLRSLYDAQLEAFVAVASELGVEDLFEPVDLELLRADLLLSLGFHWEGERALARLAYARRASSAEQLRIAAVAFEHGRAERQARTAWRLRAQLRGRSDALDDALDRIYHPTPYADAVLDAARKLELPAGLIWGLIRRESFYEAGVVSLAQAHGLMQLLESTGGRMARKLGDPVPGEEELLAPLLNVRYGTAYLDQLLAECDGDPYQALASYNAGEGNGRRWKARMGPDAPPVEMILNISYSETRGYVYHVLRFWELYGRIYPDLGRRDRLLPP